MFGCNWYPNVTDVNFWDALDYIAVSAYYPLSDHINPTVDEVKSAWTPIMKTLNDTATKFNKKVVFSEIGYTSQDNSPIHPNECCSGNLNLETQRVLFEAFFETVWQQSWFEGVFWWSWDASNTSPHNDTKDFETYGKPAQSVYSKYYK